MKKNTWMYRFISGILVVALFFSSAPFLVNADDYSENEYENSDEPVLVEPESGNVYYSHTGNDGYMYAENTADVPFSALRDSVSSSGYAPRAGAEGGLPESYSNAKASFMPPVRNQQRLNNCWAFSTIGAIEAYTLKYDLKNGLYDKDSIDYSERHLVYDMYNRGNLINDPEGNTLGDYNYLVENGSYKPWYDAGGNMMYTMWHLINWAEPGFEGNNLYEQQETISENGFDFNYYLEHPLEDTTKVF